MTPSWEPPAACGLLPEGGEVESFMVEKSMGCSEAQVAELSRDIGTLSDDKAREMAAYIEKRIAEILKRGARD
jgi:hypothetical protein